MKQKINLHFNSSTSGSIFEITNDLYEILKNEFIVTKDWEDEIPEEKEILLCHFLDKSVTRSKFFKEFKFKILIQPIDGTSIVDQAVIEFNKFDLIICPATPSKNILELNGVTSPIEVIPNFFKTNIFQKEIFTPINSYLPKNKYIFYHESTFHTRKGIEILLESFIKAFSDTANHDHAVLILKDMPFNLDSIDRIESIKKQAINLQRSFKKPVQILKFSNFLSYKDLKQIWHETNCYVSMSKIEGFGIPVLRNQMLDNEILVLQNDNSGYVDYLSTDFSYQIPSKQIEARDEMMWLYNERTKWAHPKIDDCVDYFREVYSNERNNNPASQNYNEKIFDKFEYQNVGKYYIETILKYFNG